MKSRDWIRYEEGRKRDWRAYDRFRKIDEPIFLRMAREIVFSMNPPWEVKEDGRPAIDVKSMVYAASSSISSSMIIEAWCLISTPMKTS